MNTLKTLTLALMLIICSVTGLRAEEISLRQFANEFFTSLQAKDDEKFGQLVRHPNLSLATKLKLGVLPRFIDDSRVQTSGRYGYRARL
jgi:ABC-type uncharacterized transport system fused permease/ATPase subunit